MSWVETADASLEMTAARFLIGSVAAILPKVALRCTSAAFSASTAFAAFFFSSASRARSASSAFLSSSATLASSSTLRFSSADRAASAAFCFSSASLARSAASFFSRSSAFLFSLANRAASAASATFRFSSAILASSASAFSRGSVSGTSGEIEISGPPTIFLTTFARYSKCLSNGSVNASSHCGVEMKYSSDAVGATFSIRKGIIGLPFVTARSTSRLICTEALALAEKINTMTRASSMASMMEPPQSFDGRISRGAIQQLRP